LNFGGEMQTNATNFTMQDGYLREMVFHRKVDIAVCVLIVLALVVFILINKQTSKSSS
jgi:hypothetical protein